MSVQNRNLFQKIFDEIKWFCKKATAGSEQAKQFEDLKKLFEKVYRESEVTNSKNAGETVRYALADAKIPTREELENKPDMRVVDISTPKTKGSFSERRKQILNDAIITKPYLNMDTQTMIFLTKDSYTHTFNNIGELQLNAAEHLPEFIENAVLTHSEPADHGNSYASGVYTFFAAAKTDQVLPVKLKVKEYRYSGQEIPKNIKEYFENLPQGYASTYDTVVLAVEEIEKAPSGSVKDMNQQDSFLDPEELSVISIADLLNLVKGKAQEYVPKKIVAATDSNGQQAVTELEGGTVTKYSLSTWTPETQTKVRDNLIKAGYDTAKVDSWIKDTNSVAAVIAADKDRLDFEAADNQVMLKDNQEYIKTLDASTLCAKRLIYQGTFDAIQHRMPNTMLTSDDLIELLNMMKEHGVQTPCGVCYVESRRRHLGKFAQEWLNGYNGAYKPSLDEVTTSDGLEKLRKTHPDTYKAFMDAMNKKGSSNPKVVQLRTEYRNEIMSLTPSQIRNIEAIGGLRVQSFSDFETPHMLDMMQAVMDMSAKGLHSQAYTKVPNFAWIFGDTGIKINLSLIAEGDGFDADGNLAFSSTEGMDFDEAMRIRDAYSANVGTIIVGANDQHILACMADDRIDFIIPFHRSGWGMKELHMMGMDSYTDYTYGQKEHDLATGKGVANLYPPDYWDYSLTGKENAERYLKLCAQTGREPKFSKFLVDNGDGSYSLQPDGSTDGYWKTLIDFKMYDNNGVGVPQQTVQPVFNMEQAYRVLDEYEGGANELPVANDVVDEFVAKYNHSNEIAPTKYSLSNTDYMNAVENNDTMTLQTLVDDAANAAGYQRLFYHGTGNGDFYKFKGNKPMWVTENRDYAEIYADRKADYPEDKRVMPLYAKMGNVLDVSGINTSALCFKGDTPSVALNQMARALDVNVQELAKIARKWHADKLWQIINTEQFADLARKKGYDTIKENEFGTITYGVLDPTQLKSAELVTKKRGKVVPLSERFNENKKDVRYSLSAEDEIAPKAG